MFEAFSKFLPKFKKSKPSRPIITTSENGADGTYTCRVVMLDSTSLYLDVKLTEKGQVVLNQVCSKVRLYEQEYFSLKYVENGVQKWIKLSKSINTQMPAEGPHTFFFCVRFYPMGPAKVISEICRYQIYLQIRKDIQHGKLPLPDDVCATFAALSLQADAGDTDVMDLDITAISVFKPANQSIDEFRQNVRQEQKKYEGKSQSRAEFLFLEQASWLDHYGVEMHDVKGNHDVTLQLGISPTGLLLFTEGQRVGAHYWPRLAKISFRNKTLHLRVIVTNGGEETKSYVSADKESCKTVYKSCIAHHAFFKLITATPTNQPQNSMKHSSSSSRVFSTGSKTSGKDSTAIVPDVVSGQAHHTYGDHHHHRSTRRSRRNSGSESCPESDRFVSRPSSCAAMPSGRRADYVSSTSPRSQRYHGDCSSRRMSPVSMYGGYHRYYNGRDDTDYMSGSECDFTSFRRDRGFQRDNPCYRSTIETRRGRSRPVEDASFYSEVEREPRRHHRHSRRPRIYPEELYDAMVGFGYGNDFYARHHPRYEEDYRRSHVYDRLPMDIDDHFDRETTIRWADEQGPTNFERGKQHRAQSQMDNRKRHRKRSQSPGAGTRPPQELASHFRYVDPSEAGVSDEQMRSIQYTRVETDIPSMPVRYSPRTKNKIRSSRRNGSHLRQDSNVTVSSIRVPDGEAPPPYLGAGGSPVRESHATSSSRLYQPPDTNERVEPHMSSALRSSSSGLSHSRPYMDTLENYRREVNLKLDRASNMGESSATTYQDVDEPGLNDVISRPGLSGSSKAYIDNAESYRRDMNVRIARSTDPNEAILGWYDSHPSEMDNQRRAPSRNGRESQERVSSANAQEA